MYDYQKQFIEFVIQYEILQFGEFTLKSGRQSPYFFNAGLFNTGAKLSFLGGCYADAIQQVNFDYDVLFGPAYKGIPLVSVTATMLAQKHNVDKPYCFNRKEAKAHGEKGLIVGAPLEGRVLLIDDVITAGTAIGEAVEIIKSFDASLAGIIVALDRQEKGQGEKSTIQEIAARYDVPVASIINLQDIMDYLALNEGGAYNQFIGRIADYRDAYGVA